MNDARTRIARKAIREVNRESRGEGSPVSGFLPSGPVITSQSLSCIVVFIHSEIVVLSLSCAGVHLMGLLWRNWTPYGSKISCRACTSICLPLASFE